MDLQQYTNLTGKAITDETKATAQIDVARLYLEDLLGYTLDIDKVNENQYSEVGKTQLECIHPEDVDVSNLDAADSVVNAYRIFNYNPGDYFINIDPCSAVHAVKLVNNNVTLKTFESTEYNFRLRHGFIKYLQDQDKSFWTCYQSTGYVQVAVDADWLWGEGELPNDLALVWAEVVTHLMNDKKDIRSETLGPHSYTKFDNIPPQYEQHILPIIKKYAGANGSARYPKTL